MTNNTMGNGELLVGLNGAGKTTFIKTLSGLTGLIFRVPNTCTSRSKASGNTEQSFFRPIFLKVSALRPTGQRY